MAAPEDSGTATKTPSGRASPSVDSTAHRHDGFYFQVASGIGAYNEAIGSDILDGHVRGVATAFDFAAGGTVFSGFVVGFGICHTAMLASHFDADQDTSVEPAARSLDADDARLTLLGPYVDYYVRPGDGLHIEGSIGFATLSGYSYDSGNFGKDDVALGGGFMVGLGYELWVGDQWSLGAITRLVTAVTYDEDPAGVGWLHGVGTLPNVLFSATYH